MKQCLFLFFFIFLLYINFSFAQSSIAFEIGYGRPSSNNPFITWDWGHCDGITFGDSIGEYPNISFEKGRYPVLALGSGPNISFSYSYALKKWIRFSLTAYSMSSKYLSFNKNIDKYFKFTNRYSGNSYFSSAYIENGFYYYRWDFFKYLNQLAVFPEIEFFKQIKKIEFHLIGRFGISFNAITFENAYYTLNNIPNYSYKYYESKSKEQYFSKEFLCQIGGGMGYAINKKWAINLNFYYRPLIIKPKKGKLVSLDGLTLKYNDEIVEEHSSYELFFTKDETELSNNERARRPIRYKIPTFSLSLGLRYSFGKKEKTNKYI